MIAMLPRPPPARVESLIDFSPEWLDCRAKFYPTDEGKSTHEDEP
jgi:hypothetical protein